MNDMSYIDEHNQFSNEEFNKLRDVLLKDIHEMFDIPNCRCAITLLPTIESIREPNRLLVGITESGFQAYRDELKESFEKYVKEMKPKEIQKLIVNGGPFDGGMFTYEGDPPLPEAEFVVELNNARYLYVVCYKKDNSYHSWLKSMYQFKCKGKKVK